jgi:hypothetical protein
MIMAACYVKCSTGSDIGRGIHRRMPLCRIVSDNVFFGCAHPSEHGLHSRRVVLVLSCRVCRRYEMDWEGRKMAVLMRARHRDRDRESKVLATVEPNNYDTTLERDTRTPSEYSAAFSSQAFYIVLPRRTPRHSYMCSYSQISSHAGLWTAALHQH